MGWSLGYDSNWRRDVGYGVPAVCDDPECAAEIHRGLSYVCGGEPFGGDCGCGLHFCGDHLRTDADGHQVCRRCLARAKPFTPKPDTREWLEWKLTDPSWEEWRQSEPEQVREIKNAVLALGPLPSAPIGTLLREEGNG